MPEKTLGQIGFEASQRWHGFPRTWDQLSVAESSYWDHIAAAIAQAVSPIGDPDA